MLRRAQSVASQLGNSSFKPLETGLDLVFLGTSSAKATPTRNTSCTAFHYGTGCWLTRRSRAVPVRLWRRDHSPAGSCEPPEQRQDQQGLHYAPARRSRKHALPCLVDLTVRFTGFPA